MRKLEKWLWEMYEMVRKETKQSVLRQKRVYDRNLHSINHEVRDLFWRSEPKVTVGCKIKLARK